MIFVAGMLEFRVVVVNWSFFGICDEKLEEKVTSKGTS